MTVINKLENLMVSNEQIVNDDFKNLFKVNKGLWIFILIDFLVFIGLLAYHLSNGFEYKNEFVFAKSQLLFSFGFFNTIILLTSGLTIGLSKVALFNKNNFLSTVFVFVTFMFAMIFIANRAIDCTYLLNNGYMFGSDAFSNLSVGLSSFFTTYFLIYFIFMIHLFAGIVFLVILLLNLIKDVDEKLKYIKLNFTVVYWSYLSMIWAFIFPILFLI